MSDPERPEAAGMQYARVRLMRQMVASSCALTLQKHSGSGLTCRTFPSEATGANERRPRPMSFRDQVALMSPAVVDDVRQWLEEPKDRRDGWIGRDVQNGFVRS